MMSLALEEFTEYINKDKKKKIILMLDGAGWHESKKLKVPEEIDLHPLLPYTPELQPVERSWPLFRECIANKHIESLDELTEIIMERTDYLNKNTEIIASHCGFSWIKESINHTT